MTLIYVLENLPHLPTRRKCFTRANSLPGNLRIDSPGYDSISRKIEGISLIPRDGIEGNDFEDPSSKGI